MRDIAQRQLRSKKAHEIFEATFPSLMVSEFLILLVLFLEAVFQASKASYVSQLTIFERFSILLNSFLLLSTFALIIWSAFYLVLLILGPDRKFLRPVSYGLHFILGFAFLAVASFHLDTFLYTLSKKSLYDLPFPVGLIVLFLLVDSSLILAVKKGQNVSRFCLAHRKGFWGMAFVAVIVFLFITGRRTHLNITEGGAGFVQADELRGRLNVILFSADGLDCKRLGIYGSGTNTTPNLERLGNPIIFTRAYSNCSTSRGSIISILTGKSPITTKVIHAPDILRGKDAFQHLPNILAKSGYYTADVNDGLFASSSKSNLREGFCVENGVETNQFPSETDWLPALSSVFPGEMYFLSEIHQGYKEKISYLAGVRRKLPFSYSRFLFEGMGADLDDSGRVQMITKVIREVHSPIFVHLHLMSTHGSFLRTELHDADIASVDRLFGETVDALEETGKSDNTLVVFLTDHGPGGNTTEPLPLIIYLPGNEEKRVVDEPVQYLDITPSILAALGHPIPEWMEGHVIFGDSTGNMRIQPHPIISAAVGSDALIRRFLLNVEFGPPCFGVETFSLVYDGKMYMYRTQSNTGSLYDLSGRPYDYRTVNTGDIARQYHHSLYKRLEAKGVHIKQEPNLQKFTP